MYNEIIPRLGRNELSTVKSRLKPLCSGFCEGGGGKEGEIAINPRVAILCRFCICVCIELQSRDQRSMPDIRIFTSKVLLFSCQVSSMKRERERERELCCTLDKLLHPKQCLRHSVVLRMESRENRGP